MRSDDSDKDLAKFSPQKARLSSRNIAKKHKPTHLSLSNKNIVADLKKELDEDESIEEQSLSSHESVSNSSLTESYS